jgi:trigger factor
VSVTVTDAGPFEKIVGFTVTESELDAAKAKAARRLAHEVRIRGFRPGKAPRPIVEATVGAERLRSEAIDELLPEKVGAILDEAELEPAVAPSVESIEDTDEGIAVEVRVTTWPTLQDVPEHHDRKIEVGAVEVTDEELQEQIDRIRDQFAELETVERAAEEGDYVSLDVSAVHDAEQVPEATAEQILYEVGSGGFIEGVDDAVAGMSAGESTTFDGALPAGFGEKAGLDVTYTITIGDVRAKQLPELTDEWVSEMTEFETVDEFTASLREQLGDMKKRSLANRFREQALEELVDQVELELPDALVRAEMDEILHRFAHRLEEQGIELDDYFRVTGASQETFVDDLKNQARRSLHTRLLLEAVADREGLEVPEHELDALIEVAASQSEDPSTLRSAFADGARRQTLSGDILRNKALDAIVAGAIPVDEAGNEVDLTIEEPADEVVAGEVVEGEVVEGDIIEAEVVTGSPVGGSEEE